MIRVIMERCCKTGKERALQGLLEDLRASAMRQPGYITGETLVSMDDPSYHLVISTWSHLGAWKAWEDSEERHQILQLIGCCLIEEPRVRVYGVPAGELVTL